MTSPWTPVQDWPAFLTRSAFWVWYYCNHIDVDEDDELGDEDSIEVLREIFGEDDSRDLDQLLGPGAGEKSPGSALDLPFPGKFTWRLQFDATPAVHHHLHHPDFAEPACLGWDDPHSQPPALPWREARAIVTDLSDLWQAGRTPVPECFVLPLFITVVAWRPDEEGEVRHLLRSAWARTGMLATDKVEEIVERLVRSPLDDGADAFAGGSVGGGEGPALAEPVQRLFASIRTHLIS